MITPCIVRIGLLFLVLLGAALAEEQRPVLRLLNWSTYIDLDDAVGGERSLGGGSPTLREFCELHRCDIAYQEYDAEDAIAGRLLQQPDSVDLLCCSSDLIQTLHQADLLAPIDRRLTRHAAGLAPRYRAFVDASLHPYIQPYLAGSTGILYRQDLVPVPITSWRQYFHPEPGSGRVIVFDETSILWGAAMLSAGLAPAGVVERDQAIAAGREVAALMRSGRVHSVGADPGAINAALLAGDAAMAIQWSGDAVTALAQAGGERLRYVIPDEGAEGWIDCWVLLRPSPHHDLAHAFLDFIGSPRIQARLAVELGYDCPNDAALPLIAALDPERAADPIITPPPAVQERLMRFLTPHPDVVVFWTKLRDE